MIVRLSDSEQIRPCVRPESRAVKPGRSDRWGGAVVEFAFVAPLLFFLVLAMIEFGRVMMVQQMLTNGAREGARTASLASTDADSDVSDVVDDQVGAAGISGHTTTITREDGKPWTSLNAGDLVTVRVEVRYGLVSLIGDAGLDSLTGKIFGIDFGTIGGLKNNILWGEVVMSREASSD